MIALLLIASLAAAQQPRILRTIDTPAAAFAEAGLALHRTAKGLPAEVASKVDWGSESLLVLAAGRQPSGGFGVRIESVQLWGPNLQVFGRRTSPAAWQPVTEAITHPRHAVVLSKVADGVRLKDRIETLPPGVLRRLNAQPEKLLRYPGLFLYREAAQLPALAKLVDFERESLVVLSAGTRRQGGDQLRLDRWELRGTLLTVHGTFELPPPDTSQFAAITHPAVLFVVPRVPADTTTRLHMVHLPPRVLRSLEYLTTAVEKPGTYLIRSPDQLAPIVASDLWGRIDWEREDLVVVAGGENTESRVLGIQLRGRKLRVNVKTVQGTAPNVRRERQALAVVTKLPADVTIE